MKKIVISENERGFLFKNGKFSGVLKAGKYYMHGGRFIEVVSTDEPLFSEYCSVNTLLESKDIKDEVDVVEVGGVGKQEIALHFVDGDFTEVL
ncbi:MAG: slipin family protein, partial [Clostridia bacterium]|nr:slipin family protein [Clostridia bacterium]